MILLVREGIHVRTGSPHCLFYSPEDGIAGDSRAAQSINFGTLCFHDAVVKHFHSERTDIFGFIIAFDFHVFDRIFRNFQSDGHIAAETLGSLCVGPGDKQISFRSLGAGRDLFSSGLGECFGSSQFYSIAGEGCAGHSVNIRTLFFKDRLFQKRDGSASYIGCLIGADYGQIFDSALVADLNRDLDRPLETVFHCGIGTRRIRTGNILIHGEGSADQVEVDCQSQKDTYSAHKEQAGDAASVE